MTRTVDADYLVIGAGASGMAFTDALIDHDPDVRVALVDRRDGPGGHWRAAYPFVRLHQASVFYGVASTVLGGDMQTSGPEAGMHQRADQPTIVGYYDDLLSGRMAGRVELFAGCEHDGGLGFSSLESGASYVVPKHCRIVDARYLAPAIPAEVPPPFAVDDDVRLVPVNDLPRVEDDASQHVIVGSGKTATDAIVWLLGRGTDPDAICWVRPRDPWMLNRAKIQPDPEVYLGMVADMMRAASEASSLDGLFVRLEELGIMHRIDRSVTPTMAKAPTLGSWELDLLRSVEDVVRLGHVVRASRGRLELADGSVALAADAVVVHCAADGLRNKPLVPIWQPEAITLQPVRAGFPCFGAALIGYVEATRDDDEAKNLVCRPAPLGNTLVGWARMNVVGLHNTAAFTAEPDVKDWANRVALNASRVAPEHPDSAELDDIRARVASSVPVGIARLTELSQPSSTSRATPGPDPS